MHTSADEHDVILAVLRLHLVHHDLGELVVHIRLHHDGLVVDGVDWVEHGRVAPGEGDHVVGEVLGGVEAAERLAGALSVGGGSVILLDVAGMEACIQESLLISIGVCCVDILITEVSSSTLSGHTVRGPCVLSPLG